MIKRIFIIFFIFISCNKIQDFGKNYTTNDSISIKTNNTGFKLSNNITNDKNDSIKKKHLNPEKLLGIWQYPGDINATFQIVKDSMYYVDANEWFKYKVIDDTFIIYFDYNYIDTSIWEIYDSKLILKDKLGNDTFVEFEK
jgi:hypothetical protein